MLTDQADVVAVEHAFQVLVRLDVRMPYLNRAWAVSSRVYLTDGSALLIFIFRQSPPVRVEMVWPMSRLTKQHIPPGFGRGSGKPSHHRSRRTRTDAEPLEGGRR
jgi:hypothetical protein